MLTREETEKIYMMYLGAECKYGFEGHEHIGRVVGFDYRFGFMVSNSNPIVPYRFVKHELCKLFLTTLSAITDEHAVEVAKMCNENQHDDYLVRRDWAGDIDIRMTNDATSWSFTIHDDLTVSQAYINHYRRVPMPFKCIMYLISQGYAVPLFFGIDHPCNGKTAIEAGIAIVKQ